MPETNPPRCLLHLLKNFFSSPGVHAWDTDGGVFTSLLQEALAFGFSHNQLTTPKPHKWGSQ